MDTYLRSARTEIERTVGGCSPEALSRAVEGKWSAAEILEHLTLAFTANRAAMEKALASGQLKARPPALKQQLARMMVVDVGYFPRVRAPGMTVPTGAIPADQSLTAIREALGSLDAVLSRVADRFGEGVRVANHPYFAGLTVRQWRKFHWRHTRHHMRQIRKRRY